MVHVPESFVVGICYTAIVSLDGMAEVLHFGREPVTLFQLRRDNGGS